MSVDGLLDLLAPVVATADPEVRQAAIALAASKRPACLSSDQQDEAQALYAAWVIASNMQQLANTVVRPSGVTSMTEGSLSVTFGSGDDSGIDDPHGFYRRWAALNRLCAGGAIIAGAAYDHGHG